MANPTSNFGWQMPTPVDLVTDLPADFEVFGQAVDSSLADLKGGTSGQILAKNSNTDMDFVWITNDVGDITAVSAGTGLSGGGTSGAVTLSINTAVTADLTTAQTLTNKTLTSPVLTTPTISTLTTNGDLLYGTGSGAIARAGIGSTGQVLTVAGGIPTWAAPAGGGKILQVVQATSSTQTTVASTTFTDTGLSATITPTSTSSRILVMAVQQSSALRAVNASGTGLRLLRGATNIFDMDANDGLYSQLMETNTAINNNTMARIPITYVDSPSSTSATTYKVQGRTLATSSSGQSIFQHSSSISTMILMEVGA